MAGPPSDIARAFEDWAELTTQDHGRVNYSKCGFYSTDQNSLNNADIQALSTARPNRRVRLRRYRSYSFQ